MISVSWLSFHLQFFCSTFVFLFVFLVLVLFCVVELLSGKAIRLTQPTLLPNFLPTEGQLYNNYYWDNTGWFNRLLRGFSCLFLPQYFFDYKNLALRWYRAIGRYRVLLINFFFNILTWNELESGLRRPGTPLALLRLGKVFEVYVVMVYVVVMHTWYLSFFSHRQIFWRIKFTPKNA